jgi:chemotaxis protein methyltransferase CheR
MFRPQGVDADRLSPTDFDRLGRFIQAASGIKMAPNKLTMLEMRLRRRLRVLGIDSFAAYCRRLFDEGGLQSEAVHLIDAVTTNKTDFFREPAHFRYLADAVVPELLEARGEGTQLTFWSAACSTGAEPYTLAMVLDDLAGRLPFRYSILATDICTEVLQTAIAGIYPAATLEPTPEALHKRYVQRSRDRSQGLVRIAPELRSKVRFGRLNLIEPTLPAPRDLDVVFCRNVLIYFDRPTQHQVVRRLCDHLRPGGYLFLGHSETLVGADLPLRQTAPSTFLRI